MRHSINDQLSLETLDAAIYPTRGSIEAVRSAAIREMWQSLGHALTSAWGRRPQRAPLTPQAAAA
jgi:hypothetical protein